MRAAQQRPRDLAGRDVARRQRRGEHRVVGVRVLHLDEEVERRVEQRAVHRRDREQAGRDERAVRRRSDRRPRCRRRACRRRCRSRAGRASAPRSRRGRCTRCAGTRGRCVRRAATAGGASREERRGSAQASRVTTLNRLVKLRTPNHGADRDARDEHRDVREDRAADRTCPSSRRAPARRRATAATSTRAAASRVGSWLIGKNVPENRNSGSTPSRMIIGNDSVGVLRDRERRERRAERGRAQRRGRDREDTPRRRDRAEQRGDEQERGRAEHRARSRSTTRSRRTARPARSASRPRRGKCRIHFTPPSTGHIDSDAASCIALATSSPGATNSR